MKSVIYVDPRNGEEYEQPADIVILGAYVFNNVLLMLTRHRPALRSGHGARASSARTTAISTPMRACVFFEDKENNPFMATGAFGTIIDDFNGDNFDHCPLGLHRRRPHLAGMSNGRPIATRAIPPGTPRWGKEWKEATAKWYRRSVQRSAARRPTMPAASNYLDLDPTYKDALGRPLIRMTYNFTDNDRQSRRS